MWSWLKSQFCLHSWSVRAQMVGRPRTDIVRAKQLSDDVALRLLQGYTVSILTCEKCGEVREAGCYGVPASEGDGHERR